MLAYILRQSLQIIRNNKEKTHLDPKKETHLQKVVKHSRFFISCLGRYKTNNNETKNKANQPYQVGRQVTDVSCYLEDVF